MLRVREDGEHLDPPRCRDVGECLDGTENLLRELRVVHLDPDVPRQRLGREPVEGSRRATRPGGCGRHHPTDHGHQDDKEQQAPPTAMDLGTDHGTEGGHHRLLGTRASKGSTTLTRTTAESTRSRDGLLTTRQAAGSPSAPTRKADASAVDAEPPLSRPTSGAISNAGSGALIPVPIVAACIATVPGKRSPNSRAGSDRRMAATVARAPTAA